MQPYNFPNTSGPFEEGIKHIFATNLGIENGERILILSDSPSQEDWSSQEDPFLESMISRIYLARLVREAAVAQYPDSMVRLLCYVRRPQSGADLDDVTTAAMLETDIILAPTTYSMTHTNARARASASRARIASMPGITGEILRPGGPLFVDYDALRHDAEMLAKLLSEGTQAIVRCPQGTELRSYSVPR